MDIHVKKILMGMLSGQDFNNIIQEVSGSEQLTILDKSKSPIFHTEFGNILMLHHHLLSIHMFGVKLYHSVK